MSFCTNRVLYGTFESRTPSRFCDRLGGDFRFRADGFSDADVARVSEQVISSVRID